MFITLGGTGLLLINNWDSLAESAASADVPHPIHQRAQLVALFSVFNFLGRLTSSTVSDYLTIRRGWGIYLAIAAFISIGAALMFVLNSRLLTAAAVLGGLAYGVSWSIMPTCISEMFGVDMFPRAWSLMALTPALGSVTFGVIAGWGYDAQTGVTAAQPGTAAKEQVPVCYGAKCFRAAFAAVVLLNVGCIAVALIFVRGTRPGRRLQST